MNDVGELLCGFGIICVINFAGDTVSRNNYKRTFMRYIKTLFVKIALLFALNEKDVLKQVCGTRSCFEETKYFF